MSLDERAGDPFNKRPRQGDFVPRDNFQPSEIAVRRLVGRIDVHGNVGGELMIRCAVAGVPRARIVLALSLGPRETHDDRQLCATEGAGGIVPIEANATEGLSFSTQPSTSASRTIVAPWTSSPWRDEATT